MGRPITPSAKSRHGGTELTFDRFFFEKYLPYAKARKKSAYQDEHVYQKHLSPVIGDMPLNRLTPAVLDGWMTSHLQEGLKKSTVNKHIAFVNRLLKLADKWSLTESTYQSLRLDKFRDSDLTQRFLKKSEIADLLDAAQRDQHPFLFPIVRLLLLTGCRVGEIRKAKWQDVDLDQKLWVVPVAKGGRSRRIYLNGMAVEAFRDIRKRAQHEGTGLSHRDYVVTNPKTGDCYHSFYAAWYRTLDRAGLRQVRIHDLRHTYASILINKGASIYEVQKLLGHASVNMTQRYAQLFPDTLHAKAEMAAKFLSD